MLMINKCCRCGHDWASRRHSRPDRCSRCGIKYWWRKARKKNSSKILNAGLGRPRKYRVDVLKVGQKMTLEHSLGKIPNMIQAVQAHARRSGRRFDLKETIAGLRVERIK